MRFWTASSDDLVVDLQQCEECSRWIPLANMELHSLYHQQRPSPPEDASLPAFVMETKACQDCRVLVSICNWELHRAHVCQGRRDVENSVPILENDTPALPQIELVECD